MRHTPATLADVLEKDYAPGGKSLFLAEHEWRMVIDGLRQLPPTGPSVPVEPTDDMLTAGAEVRVNLRFQNQGISGFLNKWEVREIYQRMLNASPPATGERK